ncbi:leucyl aminopeptidase [Frateuria aurantia]|uniref:Probable cytosol aminopeptidase n=1 Tax=Frateuria aurantia (strain ATCC 33424 / DSM 6220 / KCTC 2777 / LMG 1558 / NBRC 3245 / NCIMB 13370) TaxID=767434 RepID=H8L6A0_FRAAD|nr:leucyl aminopeptidase [Frateuria aurantia]AFC86777.1 leucyl aminopeptidase [Frateuria aurantia DSM 6220]
MTLQFSLTSAAPESIATACIVAGVYEGGVFTSGAARLDTASQGALKQLVDAGDLTGQLGQTLVLFKPQGVAAERILVVGLGTQKSFDAQRFQKVSLDAARAIDKLPVSEAASLLPEIDVPAHDINWKVRTAALAADHAAYRYTATIKAKPGTKPQLASLQLSGGDASADALAQASAIAAGIRFARELANLPPNICNPQYLADQAMAVADEHDAVSCRILDHVEMESLGFGSLLAVGRGSVNKPKLIALEYRGAGDDSRPYALVGKGITFDTGGISLKPGAGMDEMKFDMGGAAGVLGSFLATVKLGLPINLVCVVPAVENMPDGDAYRPGDVLTSLSGITIEVLNTDAEGRLILCDALTWTGQTYQPKAMVDAATLTGACVVALGKHASGLLSKHDDLADELLKAGQHSLDRAWRLPLWDDYQNQLESGFADVANIGGKAGGTITAACFLARFTENQRWAHLDIAGTAWDEGRKGSSTGRPVSLLTQWLIDRAQEA